MKVMRWRMSLVSLFAVVVTLVDVNGQVVCSTLDESTCELGSNEESCYWTSQFPVEEQRCDPIPNQRSTGVCVCSIDDGNGCFLNRENGTGCIPTKFCSYGTLGCSVVNARSDDDCNEDGQGTGRCVPSFYCQGDRDPNEAPFFDSDCIRNDRTMPPVPTRAPSQTTTTLSPASPTPAPTRKPTTSLPEDNGVVIGVSITLLAVASISFVVWCVFRTSKETLKNDEAAAVKRLATPKLVTTPASTAASTLVNDSPLLDLTLTKVEPTNMLRVQFEFAAQNDDELEAAEGEELTGLKMIDESWWLARNANGKEGIIPSSYVEVVSGNLFFDAKDMEDQPDF